MNWLDVRQSQKVRSSINNIINNINLLSSVDNTQVHVSLQSRINAIVKTFSQNKYQDNHKHELKSTLSFL